MARIAEQIMQVLSGLAEPESLGKYWRHDLAMPIYEKACAILRIHKQHRKAEIEALPDSVRHLVAAEVTRLYRYRK